MSVIGRVERQQKYRVHWIQKRTKKECKEEEYEEYVERGSCTFKQRGL